MCFSFVFPHGVINYFEFQKCYYAPINVNPVGRGVRAMGGDLTKKRKFE